MRSQWNIIYIRLSGFAILHVLIIITVTLTAEVCKYLLHLVYLRNTRSDFACSALAIQPYHIL